MTTVVGTALLLGACVPKTQKTPPYYGPTEPLASVVEKINQRNARIDSLRCAGSFSANLIDPGSQEKTSGDGDVLLLYTPKRNVRVQGKVLGQTVFDMASNNNRYWLILPQKVDTMWWGYHRLIGSSRARQLPIRPDLIPEVLGVVPLEKDLLKEPAPTMRFNNDARAYMLTWNVQLSDRWAVQKEVWYDVQTLQPRLVLLFDADGRIVLRAYLSRPKPVEGYDPAVEIATRYDLFFPDSGSTFSFELDDVKRTYREAPNDFSFRFPDEDRAGVSKVIQIDE